MSHFTQVETKIKNIVLLLKTLEKLGFKVKENVHYIRGYRQERTEVDYAIDTKSSIDIGIKKVGDTYHFVCDWENLETHAGIEQRSFLQQVTKAYAYENVMSQIKAKGYVVVSDKTDEQQHVHIQIRKWS